MSDFKNKISKIKNSPYYRDRLIIKSAQDTNLSIDNKELINFSSNNYLNLANSNILKKEFSLAIKKYGIGSGSSPLISGYNIEAENLENNISKKLALEATVVVNSGYMANVGIINAIAERNVAVFQDKLNHNSIIESSRLSTVELIRYKHNDYSDLVEKLKNSKVKTKIIFTDSVFSMTGQKANLELLSEIALANNAMLFIDDAHGFGAIDGCGNKFPCSINTQGLKNLKIDAYIGTFGKAVGTFGAFISGSKSLISLLIQKSKPYIYSTALPPALIRTTLKSINIISKGKYLEKLYSNINYFKVLAAKNDIKINKSETAIQSITIGDPKRVMQVHKSAIKNKILLQAIRYPTVPMHQDLLRINLTSGHTKKQIQSLIDFLKTIDKIK